MNETLTLVVNPHAGQGRAKKTLPRLCAEFRAHGIELQILETQAPGHASKLTSTALQEGIKGIGVFGGDGTLNEVLNGFFDKGRCRFPQAWLAPFPCGTGGDFRRTLNIPTDIKRMAHRFLRKKPHSIDVGKLRCTHDQGEEKERLFLNIASFGLGGEVDRIVHQQRGKWKNGSLTYLLATLKALRGYQNRNVQIQIDENVELKTAISNVAIANGRFFGGGMQIAPNANLNDGYFEIVGIERSGMRAQLSLAFSLYRGTILKQSGVFYYRGKKINVEPLENEPVFLDVDGEAFGRLPATFEILPGALLLR